MAFVKGSASGDGGELEALGNALVAVSACSVTMNCSFKASCRQQYKVWTMRLIDIYTC